jgi:lipopolysaccharide export system protein LptA
MAKLSKIFGFVCLAVFVAMNTYAQNNTSTSPKGKIKIIHADEGTSHPTLSNTHLLSGHVIFEHDSTLMHCDSAYFYLDSNAFQAFSNVNVIKGDSIKLTGDTLFYRGIEKTADLYGNINYQDRQMNMVTSALHYDFTTKIGSYNQLATITSLTDKNTLTSKKGEYHSDSQNMYFKDSVTLKNEEYKMECDTLIYSMETKIANFHGPTKIISKENTIYSEAGIYNTETEVTSLWNSATIVTKEQTLSGDSIHYEREIGIGEVYGNVIMIDTVSKVNLYGDYGYHNELLDTTAIVGNAKMEQINDKDTLYLTSQYITIKTDSANKQQSIRAYRTVKIFKSDFQAVCDSLTYNDTDSLMKFFITPILWSGKNQITGKFIEAKKGKENIEYLNINKNAFIISEIDTILYDQIKGRDINAYFAAGKISRVDVWGNGQTLYHVQNDDSLYLESNQAKCATIKINFKDEAIESIRFLDTPTAIYKATASLSIKEKYFEGFEWNIALRPDRKMFYLNSNLEISEKEFD